MVRMHTFSIVAADPQAAEWGVAVASKFLAVGAVVPWATAGAGAVATQAWANLSHGPEGLRLLGEGLSADEVVRRLTDADQGRDHRQLGVVDARGRAASYTGGACLAWAGGRTGDRYACQGNLLAGPEVVSAMAKAFEAGAGRPLPERLLAALEAGQHAGGDRRGQQSAALYVVKEGGSYGGYLDRYVDLRVDDDPQPIAKLRELLLLHRLYFGTTDPARLVRLTPEVVAEIQAILGTAGFYRGPVSGAYDEATRQAFRAWASVENFEERWRDDDVADGEVLAFLRRRFGSPQRRGPTA
ncbi:MAG: DUF1028 domain-containing protein [Armatimonadota bacterium]|nr:DUF1028 domain-containing protein [Armatimonadota bacterium]